MQNAQNAQNTITVSNTVLRIDNKQRPFSNNFVQRTAQFVLYKGEQEVHAIVVCTQCSNEPGRVYYVAYNMHGVLMGCNTLN